MGETKIKLCGIFRQEDVPLVNAARPDYCGFILNFPKSHRNLTLEQAAQLAERIDPNILRVGVFVNQPVETVVEALKSGVIHIAQLHGGEGAAEITAIQRATGKPVWKAFQVRGSEDLERAKASPGDLVLLDNGYGTGRAFNWTLVGEVGRPFALAGGLTPENIPDAIAKLHPEVLDLSSGVETNSVKDGDKMRRAVLAARTAQI